jgi:hypothetical protein
LFWKVKNLNPTQGFEHVKGYAGFAAGKPGVCSDVLVMLATQCDTPEIIDHPVMVILQIVYYWVYNIIPLNILKLPSGKLT